MELKHEQLKAGCWYALGIEDEESNINWSGAPLLCYDGEGQWSGEDGELVESIWDAFLQMPVSPNAADAYAPQ